MSSVNVIEEALNIEVNDPSAPALMAAIQQAETLAQGVMGNNQLVSALAEILKSAPPRTQPITAR